jgi:hypothetical protein
MFRSCGEYVCRLVKSLVLLTRTSFLKIGPVFNYSLYASFVLTFYNRLVAVFSTKINLLMSALYTLSTPLITKTTNLNLIIINGDYL